MLYFLIIYCYVLYRYICIFLEGLKLTFFFIHLKRNKKISLFNISAQF